jgi:hypothetical protein
MQHATLKIAKANGSSRAQSVERNSATTHRRDGDRGCARRSPRGYEKLRRAVDNPRWERSHNFRKRTEVVKVCVRDEHGVKPLDTKRGERWNDELASSARAIDAATVKEQSVRLRADKMTRSISNIQRIQTQRSGVHREPVLCGPLPRDRARQLAGCPREREDSSTRHFCGATEERCRGRRDWC